MPSGLYRSLIEERSIQKSKSHIIAGLSSCEPNSPLYLWDLLIRQAELTLAPLSPSHMNPILSAEAYLNGYFDFNCTPLTHPGKRVLIFEGLTKRRTFLQHVVEGWYLGPAPEYYQYYTVYVPATRAERIVKTVEFLLHNCPVQKRSSTDLARQEVENLEEALSNISP